MFQENEFDLKPLLEEIFPASEAEIIPQYTLRTTAQLVRRIDYLVLHQDWGVFALEVKYGSTMHLKQAIYGVYERTVNLSTLPEFSEQKIHPIVVLVSLPKGQQARTRQFEGNDISIVFSDDLLDPQSLREIFKQASALRSNNFKIEEPKKKHQIFISYRRKDTGWQAGRIYDHLSAHFGQDDVFLDMESINLGKNFQETIRNRVISSGIQLVIIGNDWLTISDTISGIRRLDELEDWVRTEVEIALEKGLVVIPILVDGTKMPLNQYLPIEIQELSHLQAFKIDYEYFHIQMEKLCKMLDNIIESSQ